MSYIRQSPTEECPLTKDTPKSCLDVECCKCGFKTIVGIFALLTAAITAALILQLMYQENVTQGRVGVHGAVATDNANCSSIGLQILRKGGNAIDAAIAATLCTTVVVPHKTSLGGGGYILIYNKKHKKNPLLIDFASNTVKGDLKQVRIRIPAVLKGLEFAHKSHGKTPWNQLVEPAANLANHGFIVPREWAQLMTKNDKFYGQQINAGELVKIPLLAETFTVVSKLGTRAFYNGSLTEKLLPSNSSSLGATFKQDLAEFTPRILSFDSSSMFYSHDIFYPSHATLLPSILARVNEMNLTEESSSSILTQAHVIETIVRLKGEIQSLNEDGRYTGVMALDGQGTFVCVLSGTNAPLNVKLLTDAGFALDTVFQSNYLLNLVPVVFDDKTSSCGLSGIFGTDDETLVAQSLYNLIVRSQNISEVIESPRYHVYNDGVAFESDDVSEAEAALRHALKSVIPADDTFAMKSVNIVIKRGYLIKSHSDSRGEGLAYRF